MPRSAEGLCQVVRECADRPRAARRPTQHRVAREQGIIDALTHAGVRAVADHACRGGGPVITVPQKVNVAPARQRGPGERVNAGLRN